MKLVSFHSLFKIPRKQTIADRNNDNTENPFVLAMVVKQRVIFKFQLNGSPTLL